MTTKIQLPIPTVDSTKAEEIDTLTKLTNAVQDEQSYLSQLFTQDLLNWAVGRIVDDGSPDIMADMKLVEAERDLARTEQELLKGDLQRQKDYIAHLEYELEHNKDILNRKYAEIDNMRAYNIQIADDLLTSNQELTALKQEVIELKAKLYDLIVK